MKEFLIKLTNGVKIKDFNSKQKELIRNFKALNVVFEDKGFCYLKNDFYCGKIDISSDGTGYLIIFSEKKIKDFLIEKKDLSNAHFGDIVLAKILKTKKKRTQAKVLMIIKPANSTSVVYTKNFKNKILGVNLKTSHNLDLNASQKSLKQLPELTLLKIDNINNEIKEVLGNLNDPFTDEKISLALFNKPENFSDEANLQAKSFGDIVDVKMYQNRIDLQNLPFCTIDPVDAKDYDDAIFYDVKNNELYVAIADVSEYVTPYCAIDKEAKTRGFSIYFPHISVPMLPRNLSENICSLKPNLARLAFVFKIKFDTNFKVVDEKLFSGIICSKRRFNYDEIDEILEKKSGCENEILSWILPLFKITQKIRKNRLKIGFDFRSDDLRMTLDQNGEILSTRFENSSNSHALIEDCMLLANQAAAKMINFGIFRNHPPADEKRISNLLSQLAVFGIKASFERDLNKMISKIQAQADLLNIRKNVDKLIIKAQKKAIYDSQSSGHFGLGFETYTHFTSPIRRYSDLILHRLLKAKLAQDEKFFNYLLLNIDETCENLNELEREVDKVEYDFFDRKFARWAAKNIGKKFRCFISENDKFFIAELDDELKGAKIYLKNGFEEILTPVLVKITESRIAEAKIFGEIVGKIDV